jgi:hypothetical protein
MKNLIFLLLITAVFSNCNIIRGVKIEYARDAERMMPYTNFKREIPFKTVNGHIVIEATIDGKKGNFILDTGASTMLDEDFSNNLSLNILGKSKHKDATGKKKILKTVALNNLTIGDIAFEKIIATTGGLDIIKVLKLKNCIDISGLIGANVMNKGVWQIDYRRQKITITDTRDSLHFPSDKKTISFDARGGAKKPVIKLKMNGIDLGDAVFDTGNNSTIGMSNKTASAFLPFKTAIKQYRYGSGAFGMYVDTSYTAKLPNLTFGQNFETMHTIVTVNSHLTDLTLIGYQFLKDYVVAIDWKYQEITFYDYQPSKENPYFTFGFTPLFQNEKLIVGGIMIQSAADKAGLKLNDEILEVNGIDCRKIAHATYCDLKYTDADTVRLTVKKGDKEVNYTLTKTDLSGLLEMSDK